MRRGKRIVPRANKCHVFHITEGDGVEGEERRGGEKGGGEGGKEARVPQRL